MGVLTLVKLGFGARGAFRQWREHVRGKKNAKLKSRGLSDSATKARIDEEERQVNFVWNALKSAVRHWALSGAGGFAVATGVATDHEWAIFVGVLMNLVSYGFSVARKWFRFKKTGTAD